VSRLACSSPRRGTA